MSKSVFWKRRDTLRNEYKLKSKIKSHISGLANSTDGPENSQRKIN